MTVTSQSEPESCNHPMTRMARIVTVVIGVAVAAATLRWLGPTAGPFLARPVRASINATSSSDHATSQQSPGAGPAQKLWAGAKWRNSRTFLLKNSETISFERIDLSLN